MAGFVAITARVNAWNTGGNPEHVCEVNNLWTPDGAHKENVCLKIGEITLPLAASELKEAIDAVIRA